MEQTIIIKKNQYFTETEEENISKLKMDFIHTHFSTYDTFRNYLHVQVGDYDEFNFYLEMSPREAEEFFLKLADQARKKWMGF
ncbi:hypothetical protein HMPREF3291_05130 [Bacillus sp. HMSC76G11]|nr:hypothetical protein HMPREF3291_05130 [Bacillus sp. HMSC76G11]